MPYIVTDICILCGACVAGCPSGAIEEGETQCRIDVDICIECGTCEQNCPSGAIVFVEQERDARGVIEKREQAGSTCIS